MLRQSRVLDFSSCALPFTPTHRPYTATPFFPLSSTHQSRDDHPRPFSGTLYSDIRRSTPSPFIVSRFSSASEAVLRPEPRLIIDMFSDRVRDEVDTPVLVLPDWMISLCCSNGDCMASASSFRLRTNPSSCCWEKAARHALHMPSLLRRDASITLRMSAGFTSFSSESLCDAPPNPRGNDVLASFGFCVMGFSIAPRVQASAVNAGVGKGVSP